MDKAGKSDREEVRWVRVRVFCDILSTQAIVTCIAVLCWILLRGVAKVTQHCSHRGFDTSITLAIKKYMKSLAPTSGFKPIWHVFASAACYFAFIGVGGDYFATGILIISTGSSTFLCPCHDVVRTTECDHQSDMWLIYSASQSVGRDDHRHLALRPAGKICLLVYFITVVFHIIDPSSFQAFRHVVAFFDG